MNEYMDQDFETRQQEKVDIMPWTPEASSDVLPDPIKKHEQKVVELAPEVETALQIFIAKFRREFTTESNLRAKAEQTSKAGALQATINNARKHIAEHSQAPVPTLSEKSRNALQKSLRDIEDREHEIKKNLYGGRATTNDRGAHAAIAEAYFEKRYQLHKELHPNDPTNIVEMALLDKATIDTETRIMTSLFPFSNKAKHAQYAAEDRARAEEKAKELAEAATNDPPTLVPLTPTKKPSLWQRLLGRG